MIETNSIYQEHTKVIVPTQLYDLKNDKRLLIPFLRGERIGFIDNSGKVIVPPKYMMYCDECYKETDYIRVANIYPYGFIRKAGEVAAYKRPLYGLLDYRGTEFLPVEYLQITPSLEEQSQSSTPILFTVQRKDGQYAIITQAGDIIVNYGKYAYIDGIDSHGLVRVKIKKSFADINSSIGYKFGIINKQGKEILPIAYDNIWRFYGKDYTSIIVEKDGHRMSIFFTTLLSTKMDTYKKLGISSICCSEERYGNSYTEYEGSWAQEVEGYSDDVINDAFDGDPDAYWNID